MDGWLLSARVARRGLLLGTLAAALSACVRPAASRTRPEAEASSASLPDAERWEREARAILSDGLAALRVFDTFAAFRIANAVESALRSASELAWDPPTGADWDEAVHVARGLHGRAEQLFKVVASSPIDPSAWRERRELADATHGLIDLGDALAAYPDRVDHLYPGGDGSAAFDLLEQAWSEWMANAARWGVTRDEPIACS